ncbi:PREDICTED: NAD-dependent protein lipoamidase sirtuin-4, mitochondrial-like [Acropora digitifera]|uniref:NAD-dependent protein lipoamidase sirtuin-4, mitochondrial-like n=1 Tax=Acropora digitifera TaxID=70779 RepID=UPI00077A504B|nr:PREDICTED: NAD-dependent protein lipoamidase sirtuin-4, mitochondrial-like [Acropora digitifera]
MNKTRLFSKLRDFSRSQRSIPRIYVPKCERTDGEIIEAVRKLDDFISKSGRLFVLTGAGISTESGIRDYRSEGVGLYAITEQRPIEYTDFLKSSCNRRRYWARNYVGWEEFSGIQPNGSHFALADLEKVGKVNWLVTQNVDALHTKAGSQRVSELHGCAHRVVCLGCNQITSRHDLQHRMKGLNVVWNATADGHAPDGDSFLSDEDVQGFQVPACLSCGGILKPDVIFFGDSVPKGTVSFIHERLFESDSLLIIGSSVQVYSSYRFVHAAWEQNKPIAILNIGPTRADKLLPTLKLSVIAGDVLPRLRVLSPASDVASDS